MGYYTGKFVIHNNTDNYNLFEQDNIGHILTMKFSANFNDMKLFLTNTLVKQLLSSKALQKFIVNEIDKYMDNNIEKFNSFINKICFIEQNPIVKINVIGKYFFIKVYCGRNHTKEDCIKAVKLKLSNEKTVEEVLRGENIL